MLPQKSAKENSCFLCISVLGCMNYLHKWLQQWKLSLSFHLSPPVAVCRVFPETILSPWLHCHSDGWDNGAVSVAGILMSTTLTLLLLASPASAAVACLLGICRCCPPWLPMKWLCSLSIVRTQAGCRLAGGPAGWLAGWLCGLLPGSIAGPHSAGASHLPFIAFTFTSSTGLLHPHSFVAHNLVVNKSRIVSIWKYNGSQQCCLHIQWFLCCYTMYTVHLQQSSCSLHSNNNPVLCGSVHVHVCVNWFWCHF